MEASSISNDDYTEAFKHCLEGKARVWYDETDIPTEWDDLSDKFCQTFLHTWQSIIFQNGKSPKNRKVLTFD